MWLSAFSILIICLFASFVVTLHRHACEDTHYYKCNGLLPAAISNVAMFVGAPVSTSAILNKRHD
jgi:hypothetical protein